jgi:hypothetical protein
MAEFVDLRRRLADETTPYIDPATVRGIRNWFFNHVIAEDREYAPTSSRWLAGGFRRPPPRDPPEYAHDPRQLHPIATQRRPYRCRTTADLHRVKPAQR